MASEYEVLAVRYGVWQTRRSESFYRYGSYGEDDRELQMDYYFWIVRNSDTTILVDTGYDPKAIKTRSGRVCLIPPVEALGELGIDVGSVSRVIVSHFHYDHIGNVSSFPEARITLQLRELEFWTGPHGKHRAVASSTEAEEIEYLELAISQGRVDCIDGDAVVAPGVSAQLVGGHCPGQQIVVIDGARPIVLASDALHLYEEMERNMPFEVIANLTDMYNTYAVLRRFEAEQGAIVVAGHDPMVMERFESIAAGGGSLAVRVEA